jgi:hypothetical protein
MVRGGISQPMPFFKPQEVDMRKSILLVTAMLLGTGFGALAEDVIGKNEYLAICSVCHGANGGGNGPFAAVMNVEVPSLTTLSANNDGEFPFLKVFMTIDGRSQTEGHGAPMPVWGDRFMAQTDDRGYGPYGSELVVRGRILSLVEYLQSIQE